MPIYTKRWNDALPKKSGEKILICRYRPRALKKADETWDVWLKELGPSLELHAAAYGKFGAPISWRDYKKRYLQEQKNTISKKIIQQLAKRIKEGKTITLLCSSACTDATRCHRSLLKNLITKAIKRKNNLR